MVGVDKVARWGQVFTPDWVVREMVGLRRRFGRVLEPSCGDGAFLARLGDEAVGVEVDAALPRLPNVIRGDFFALPAGRRFETIIGNPPYVRYRDIALETRALLPMARFDGRSNLYLFFIDKCLDHLAEGGELIFITPRDFMKATSARRLNARLYEEGGFSYFRELGDAAVFAGFSPNCAIWRWVKGRRSRWTVQGEKFCCRRGQIWFGGGGAEVGGEGVVGDWFEVKVGAVSGADGIFGSARHGNVDMVCSRTVRDGGTRRMIYNVPHRCLLPHKAALMARRVRVFDESNWWEWGRRYCESAAPRVYVNCKTRVRRPFFAHEGRAYDGSVLALMVREGAGEAGRLAEKLNAVDWGRLGFAVDGRLIFTQRSLMNAVLGW